MKNIIAIGLIKGMDVHDGQFLFVVERDGGWRFPGGHVKAGESLEIALRRELSEETGIKVINNCRLVLIEHAAILDRERNAVDKSILLYFFSVDTEETVKVDVQHRMAWLGKKDTGRFSSKIPYDNFLIVNGIDHIKKDQHYIVPKGFLDTPKKENKVEVRTFCWITERP